MQINLEHFHYWMQAVRQSPDPMRTLDCFWQGQMKSKEWLCKHLRKHVNQFVTIDIHGGWYGVLASMLFQSNVPAERIRSIDIDPECEEIANMMNKLEEMHGKFTAITADMCTVRSETDVIINTSCEHITQEQYESWLALQPDSSLFVLQSNNYEIPEHIRIAYSLEEFKQQSKLAVVWAGELKLPMYTRYMIIGRKGV